VQQGKGTSEVGKVQGVRNLGKETRGDLLFLERLQPKEQQKRTVEKSVEYFAGRNVLSHCALGGFEGTRTGRLAVGSSSGPDQSRTSREPVLPYLHVARAHT